MRMGEAAATALSHNAAVPAQQERVMFGEQCKEGAIMLYQYNNCATEYGGDHSRI